MASKSNASKITYNPSRLPGCEEFGKQATSSADREWCALTTALACWGSNGRIDGLGPNCGVWGPDVRMLDDASRVGMGRMFHKFLAQEGVDYLFASRWADAIEHKAFLQPIVTEVTGVDGTTYVLDEYQIDVMRKCQIYGAVLDLDTGLGKTSTGACIALSIAAQLQAARTRCWIVCPLNAFGTWRNFEPALQEVFEDVRIISMDSTHKVRGDTRTGGVIIWDEVHNLGVPKSQRTKHALEVRKTFHSGFSLTGTLLHGGVEKALSIHDLAIPGSAVFASRWKAGEFFSCLVKNKFGTELKKPGAAGRDRFYRWLSRHTISLDKRDEDLRHQIGLGGIDQELVTVNVGEPWPDIHDLTADVAIEIYDEMREEHAASLAAWEADPEAVPDERPEYPEFPHAARVLHRIARLGFEEKFSWLVENLDDEDLPIVVGCHYSSTVEQLIAEFDAAGMSYVVVDGSVSGDSRPEIERAFQAGEADVFIGQIRAASVAMNLFRSCVSVTFDRSWKADDYYQFLGRTFRRGQTRDCVHVDLVANDLQAAILSRVQDAMDFDAECSEWQKTKGVLKELKGQI